MSKEKRKYRWRNWKLHLPFESRSLMDIYFSMSSLNPMLYVVWREIWPQKKLEQSSNRRKITLVSQQKLKKGDEESLTQTYKKAA